MKVQLQTLCTVTAQCNLNPAEYSTILEEKRLVCTTHGLAGGWDFFTCLFVPPPLMSAVCRTCCPTLSAHWWQRPWAQLSSHDSHVLLLRGHWPWACSACESLHRLLLLAAMPRAPHNWGTGEHKPHLNLEHGVSVSPKSLNEAIPSHLVWPGAFPDVLIRLRRVKQQAPHCSPTLPLPCSCCHLVTTGLLATAALAASFLLMELLNLEYVVLSEPGTCTSESRQNTTVSHDLISFCPFTLFRTFLCHAAWAQPTSEQQAMEMRVGLRWLQAVGQLGGERVSGTKNRKKQMAPEPTVVQKACGREEN